MGGIRRRRIDTVSAARPRIFTGEGVTHPYSLGLLTFMAERALWKNDPQLLRIA